MAILQYFLQCACSLFAILIDVQTWISFRPSCNARMFILQLYVANILAVYQMPSCYLHEVISTKFLQCAVRPPCNTCLAGILGLTCGFFQCHDLYSLLKLFWVYQDYFNRLWDALTIGHVAQSIMYTLIYVQCTHSFMYTIFSVRKKCCIQYSQLCKQSFLYK